MTNIPERTLRSTLSDALGFLTAYVRNPMQVGSLTPSSRALVAQMLDGLNLTHARIVVEFGPGTGAFTGAVLERIPADALYFALEPNPAFREHIAKRFPTVQVIGDAAEMAVEHLSAHAGDVDAVISGIPFSLMSRESLAATVDASAELLKPGGNFRTFVYRHVYHMPKLVELRRQLSATYTKVSVVPVMANLPPALVLRCVK